MKKLSSQEEEKLLYECIVNNRSDLIFMQYWRFIDEVIRNTLRRFKISFTQEDVEDFRNDSFGKLFEDECKRIKQYNPKIGISFSQWIAIITNRLVQNSCRKKSVNGISERQNRIDIQEIEEQLGIDEYEKRLEARQLIVWIEESLNKLTPMECLVFKLYYYEGLSLQDIASSMHRSVNAVYTAKSRAINRLKIILKDKNGH